jgi:hypothetical protein
MATKTINQSNALLNHAFKNTNYPKPRLFIGLLISLPSEEHQYGQEPIGSSGTYHRGEITNSMNFFANGKITNTSKLSWASPSMLFNTTVGFGIYTHFTDPSSLIYWTAINPVVGVNSLNWLPGGMSFNYTLPPLSIQDWDDRPLEDVFEGYEIIYEPTNTKFVYSENVRDYVRYQYWKSFTYDLQAEISGEYHPLEEPNYPWDSAVDLGGSGTAIDGWSIYNDGNKNWARNNTMPFSSNYYSLIKKYTVTNSYAYFIQGYVHVLNNGDEGGVSGRSAVWLLGYQSDKKGMIYTLSGGNSPYINKVAHVIPSSPSSTSSVSGGTHFYTSALTNSDPVYIEIYGIRKSDSSLKSLIYINHTQEPINYYDENLDSFATIYNQPYITLGDGTLQTTADSRYREFKFGLLWSRF